MSRAIAFWLRAPDMVISPCRPASGASVDIARALDAADAPLGLTRLVAVDS